MDDPDSTGAGPGRFDAVAAEYEQHRPTYPDTLVDAVCAAAGLSDGDTVLEIGCGPGQLTSALTDRGLSVLAVEPGERLIERARTRVGGGDARFVAGRFEDADLGSRRFAAAFSATAFHWVDPQVGWAKVASCLEPGAAFVLISHTSGASAETIQLEQALFDAVATVAPDAVAGLPRPREATETLAGAEPRRGNLSESWSWLSQFELAVPEAAALFGEVQVLHEQVEFELTAEQLNAQRRTTSWFPRLGPERAAAIDAETDRIIAGLGGQVRLPVLVLAAVARTTAAVASG